MAIYQSIGDLGGTTTAYTDLSRMLWSAGDLDGAKTAAQHVLDLSRETGDLRMQTWGLQALATAASDEAASDEVLDDYRETIALDEKTANDSGMVWHLSAYADVLRLRGDLAAARSRVQARGRGRGTASAIRNSGSFRCSPAPRSRSIAAMSRRPSAGSPRR